MTLVLSGVKMLWLWLGYDRDLMPSGDVAVVNSPVRFDCPGWFGRPWPEGLAVTPDNVASVYFQYVEERWGYLVWRPREAPAVSQKSIDQVVLGLAMGYG